MKVELYLMIRSKVFSFDEWPVWDGVGRQDDWLEGTCEVEIRGVVPNPVWSILKHLIGQLNQNLGVDPGTVSFEKLSGDYCMHSELKTIRKGKEKERKENRVPLWHSRLRIRHCPCWIAVIDLIIVRSLLWCGLNPWPRNFHMPWVWPRKTK